MTKFKKQVIDILNSTRGYLSINDLRKAFLTLYFFKYADKNLDTNEETQNGQIDNYLFSLQLNREITSTRASRFDKVIFKAKVEDVFHSIFQLIQKGYPELSDVFDTFEMMNLMNRHPQEILEIHRGLANIDFNILQNYKDGFNQIIEVYSEREGKSSGVNNTPRSVRELFEAIIGDVDSIMDPACGAGALLDEFVKKGVLNIYGQDIVAETLAIAKLRFAFDPNIELNVGDSLSQSQLDKLGTDAVVIVPPLNMRLNPDLVRYGYHFKYGVPSKKNANLLWPQFALNHLNDKGRAVILLSNSSLYSGGQEGEVRKAILKDGHIEAIIALPPGLFQHSSIPTTIWVLSKERSIKEEILMIDISDLGHSLGKFGQEIPSKLIADISSCFKSWSSGNGIGEIPNHIAKPVSYEEISENEYVLAPTRYMPIQGLDEYDLSEAVELGEIISKRNPISTAEVQHDRVRDLSIKNLASSIDKYEIDINTLDFAKSEKRLPVFKGDSLLIANKGDNLKPSYLSHSDSEFAMMNVFAFKVNTKRMRMDYLIQELNKNYVQLQLSRLRTGAVIPNLKLSDLLSIKIIVPNLAQLKAQSLEQLEEQELAVKREKEIRFQSLAKLHGFEKEIERLKELQRKDLGSKKHNIMQHLNNVKSSSDVLLKFLLKNQGILKADQVINPKTGVTVLKRFERMGESIDSVLFYTDNLTNDIQFEKPEAINAHTLVKESVERGVQPSNASIKDESELETFKDQKPMILVSKLDFEELYNNIIQNAIEHGFIEPGRQYEFRYSVLIRDGKVEITFTNNGHPFPKGMGVKEIYCTRGEKAGINGNTGEGSWKVCQIAQHFGAELDIFDEPDAAFPVGIKLTFDLVQ